LLLRLLPTWYSRSLCDEQQLAADWRRLKNEGDFGQMRGSPLKRGYEPDDGKTTASKQKTTTADPAKCCIANGTKTPPAAYPHSLTFNISSLIMADAPAPAAGKPKKEKKAPPADLVIPPKKPKMSKAERRALQEAQRAAKADSGGGAGGKGKGGAKGVDNKASAADAKKSGDGGSGGGGSQENQRVDPAMDKRLPVFAHLPQYKGEWQVKWSMR